MIGGYKIGISIKDNKYTNNITISDTDILSLFELLLQSEVSQRYFRNIVYIVQNECLGNKRRYEYHRHKYLLPKLVYMKAKIPVTLNVCNFIKLQ